MAKTSKDKTIAVKCKLINNNRSCARVICCHRGGGICLEYFAELEERTLLNARVSRLRTYAVSSSDV